MLIYRTATRSFSAASRRYSTQTPASKPANWPLILSGAGVAGLAAYVYLGYREKGTLLGSGTPVPPRELKPALDKDNFVAFEVKKIEPYNHNTNKYTFALPEGTASLLPIASAILARAADDTAVADKDGKPIIRPYTPISDPATPGEIELLIKKYDTGKLTPHIHSLKVGDKFSLKGPIPKWPYKINEFDEVGLIGGGSGITPLYQVLTHALRDPSNKTKFKLIYANVSPADILLREEFEALKAKHPDHFDYVFVVDKGDSGWKGPTGYITSELLKRHLAPPSVGEKVKVFICGPPGQVNAIAGPKDRMKQGELKGILKELGYSEGQVYKF